MKNKKKYIWSGLFLAALFALTLYYLLRGDGLRQLCRAVQQANPIWLAAGLAVMIGFVVCEAWNTRQVMRPLCGKVPFFALPEIRVCRFLFQRNHAFCFRRTASANGVDGERQY